MQSQETPSPSNLISFDSWLRGIEKTRVTGFRYRKAGLIETVNIFGRLYVTREEIARFESRAMAGDFARTADTKKAAVASLNSAKRRRSNAVA